jgi:uncharacterized membrane protein YbhN (UPF0104 family)
VLYEIVENQVWQIDRADAYALGWRVGAGAFVYAISSVLLGAAWWRLLAWAGETIAHKGICHGIYGRAQLAKYVPGNVFSFVGRQVLGHRAGLSHWGLAAASVLEIAGQLLAAGLIGMTGYRTSWHLPAGHGLPLLTLLLIAALLAACLAVVVLRKRENAASLKFMQRPVKDYVRLVIIFGLYVPFFVIAGTILWFVIQGVADHSRIEWTYVLSISAVAWLLGFVVPGAPGGIGVRDAILIVGLTPAIGGYAASAATVAYRVVTVLGDILYFLVSHALPVEAPKPIDR